MIRLVKWLVLIACVMLWAVPASADSWDVVASFNTQVSNGTWSYGYASVASMPSSYSFTGFRSSLGNWHDGTAGYMWLKDSTTVDSWGDQCPMIGKYSGTSAYYVFRLPPTPPGYDVYCQTNASAGLGCIFRWTAPTAGDYTFSGHVSQANSGHIDNYWVVYRNLTPTNTTLISGTVSAADMVVSRTTPLTMQAGESLDFCFAAQANARPWTRFDMVVSGTGTQPAGVIGYVQDAAGNRVAGATISDGTHTATTANDGTYQMVIPSPGTYTISASAAGLQSQSVPGVVVGSTGMVVEIFTLTTAIPFVPSNGLLLPDMQNMPVPSPEPVLPVACDTFTPPIGAAKPATGTPTFAEWIRTGAPDDTIVATGDLLSSYSGTDLGKDSAFAVYGQSTSANGALVPAKIQRLDALKTAFTIDSTMPSWSMYMVWPRNSVGYGAPIAVNKTEAWWLGPKKAERGAMSAVYGRNLSHDNGTATSWVYIKKDANTMEQATVTAVNPYRVAFTVPSDLSDGNYEVWIHNGHGGHYGWAGPLTLQVYTHHAWSGPVINVKSAPYNALGDGSTNDSAAVSSAFSAAASTPYSTVYFPAGTYMVTGPITNAVPSNTKVLGDGSTISTLKLISGHSVFSQTAARSNIEIDNIGMDSNNMTVVANSHFLDMENVTDLWFNNSLVKCLGEGAFYFPGTVGLYFNNCEIDHGIGGFLSNPKQAFFDNCRLKAANDAEGALGGWGNSENSVTNCTISDYDNTQSWGWGEGRFYCEGGAGGSVHNNYLGNNTTIDMTVRTTGGADQNSGEQMLWESGMTHWRGTVIAADATHATFGSSPAQAGGNDAIVVAGKGIGQHRSIASASGNTLTLATPWTVIPDSTSSIIIESIFDKVAVYQNSIDAKDNAAASGSFGTGPSSMGVDPDGGCFDFVVDGNTFHQTRFGIMNTAYAYGDIQPNYFMLFTNNICDSNRYPMALVISYDSAADAGKIVDPPVSVQYLANVYRKNSAINQVLAGANNFPVSFSVSGSWPWAGPAIDMLVLEHNTMSNAGTGIDTSAAYKSGVTSLGSMVVYKNSFSRNSTASTNIGIKMGTGESPAIRENTWTNFGTIYSGSSLGAVLEAPKRVFEVIGSAGGAPVTTQLTLWNAGTSSLSWLASDDASWLGESLGSGSITGEGQLTTLTLTCDPTGLAPGSYTGTITSTGSSQTKKMTVLFSVCSPYINAAKQTADKSPVSVVSGVVSAVFGSNFYVQALDRSCGIMVQKPSHGFTVGMKADITGIITTDSDGERYVVASTSLRNGSDTIDVPALFVPNKSLGGGDYSYSSSNGAGQEGIVGASGLNNIGLLVRTTGVLTYSDPSGAFVYVDDGSGASDGNTLGAGGTAVSGVKVLLPSGVTWPTGSYFGVTGVSSLTTVGSSGARAIKVRTGADIDTML